MTDVVDLPGGYTEWEREGLPTVRGDGNLADLVLGPSARLTQPST
jgi:hypothetical protein